MSSVPLPKAVALPTLALAPADRSDDLRIVAAGERQCDHGAGAHRGAERGTRGLQGLAVASTVTCSLCAPTSRARSSTGVSVTFSVTAETSAVLNPFAANRTL